MSPSVIAYLGVSLQFYTLRHGNVLVKRVELQERDDWHTSYQEQGRDKEPDPAHPLVFTMQKSGLQKMITDHEVAK